MFIANNKNISCNDVWYICLHFRSGNPIHIKVPSTDRILESADDDYPSRGAPRGWKIAAIVSVILVAWAVQSKYAFIFKAKRREKSV